LNLDGLEAHPTKTDNLNLDGLEAHPTKTDN
jgi:hypothetical protein